ncbi:MAG: hypothetical protein R2851_15370 [Caldilineaceae bacterium]
MAAARQLGVEIESICGSHQTCGKVMVEEGDFAKFGIHSHADHLTPPGERELDYAAKRNFAPGMRLSCACQLTGDVVIRVPEESQLRKQVVRKAAGVARAVDVDAAMRLYYVELPAAELKDHRGDWERLRMNWPRSTAWTTCASTGRFSPCSRRRWPKATALLTATVWNEKAKSCMSGPPRRHRHRRGRVGTTTVAGNLCHLRTGEILASASRMNPQVPFGEDLMSRVSYAMMSADGTERMQAIIAGLNELVDEMCAQAGIAPADVIEMVLVGNTTMRHLLLGVNRELGGAPFNLVVHSAVDVKARSGPGHRTGRQHPHPALRSGSRGCGQRGRAGGRGALRQGRTGAHHRHRHQRRDPAGQPGAGAPRQQPHHGPAFEKAQIVHGMPRTGPSSVCASTRPR